MPPPPTSPLAIERGSAQSRALTRSCSKSQHNGSVAGARKALLVIDKQGSIAPFLSIKGGRRERKERERETPTVIKRIPSQCCLPLSPSPPHHAPTEERKDNGIGGGTISKVFDLRCGGCGNSEICLGGGEAVVAMVPLSPDVADFPNRCRGPSKSFEKHGQFGSRGGTRSLYSVCCYLLALSGLLALSVFSVAAGEALGWKRKREKEEVSIRQSNQWKKRVEWGEETLSLSPSLRRRKGTKSYFP